MAIYVERPSAHDGSSRSRVFKADGWSTDRFGNLDIEKGHVTVATIVTGDWLLAEEVPDAPEG
jgi:hypothetical protein